MHIGNKLRFLIETRSVSKKDFAEALDTTEQNLHKILNKDSIQLNLLLRFCKLLEVHPNHFFEDWDWKSSPVDVSESVETYKTRHRGRSSDIEKVSRIFDTVIDEIDKRIKELEDHIKSLKREIRTLKKKE